MAIEASRWHWRNTAIQAHFFFLDASVALPILLWMVHMRQWTFYLAIGFMVVLWILDRKGFTPLANLLYLRARVAQWIGGGKRPTGNTFEFTRRKYFVR